MWYPFKIFVLFWNCVENHDVLTTWNPDTYNLKQIYHRCPKLIPPRITFKNLTFTIIRAFDQRNGKFARVAVVFLSVCGSIGYKAEKYQMYNKQLFCLWIKRCSHLNQHFLKIKIYFFFFSFLAKFSFWGVFILFLKAWEFLMPFIFWKIFLIF